MRLNERLKTMWWSAAVMEPEHERGLRGLRRAARRVQSVLVFALLDANHALIGRFASGDGVYDPDRWPWVAGVRDATADIRVELLDYLTHHQLPSVAELAGVDPDTIEGQDSLPGLVGSWRTVLLFTNGGWIDDIARYFPRTVGAFDDISPKANVGFTALGPGSHILPHVDPNRGALRLQLPIVVPASAGTCRLRVGNETLVLTEGEPLVFDVATEHEVWNEGEGDRVVLAAEIPMPLPRPWSWVNRAAQHSYRWHPSYRGLLARLVALGGRSAASDEVTVP